MKYDFQAQYSIALYDRITLQQAIDYLAQSSNRLPRDGADLTTITDDSARLQLLAQAIISPSKNRARVGDIRGQTGGLHHWIITQSTKYLQQQMSMMQGLHLLPTLPQITTLPRYSFGVQFDFTLIKPYLSKDDTALHLLDNPVKKEWVFKLPYVASTQWKGSLRHALWHLGHQKDDEQIKRLFGTANDDQPVDGNRGRLYFYPTFFDQIGLEVINPHDRKSGAGTHPIYFECVPIGATGTFTLLYTPLDRIGEEENVTKQQVFFDLQLVAEGLEAMFTVYGFGAKTSSGFGVAEDVVDNGTIQLKIPDVVFPQDEQVQVQEPEAEFHKYLDDVGAVASHFEGSGEEGLMSNSEYKKHGKQYGGGSLSEFKKFRRWYGEHGEQWQAQLQTAVSETTYPTGSFDSLSHLVEIGRNVEVKSEGTIGGEA